MLDRTSNPRLNGELPPELEEPTGDDVARVENPPENMSPKNPAAVALGRLGRKKGGPARARKLTAKRRQDIARIAAQTRWNSQKAVD